MSSSSLEPATPDTSGAVAPEAGRRRWPWVVGTLVVAGGITLLRCGRAPEAPKGQGGRPVPVVIALARVADVPLNLTGLGTATALNTVTVRSRVDGQITQVAFQEGQLVRQGDLLVQIDPRPFQVQLTQAEGQLAKDEAALRNARNDLQRFQALLKDGILSRQQLDTQTTSVAQFEAAVKADHGQVEGAKLNLTYSRITAPVGGRVGLRQVDLGNMVRANDPTGLLTITQVQPITVLFTIPADRIPLVQARMKPGHPLAAEAFDRDLVRRLGQGTLVAIDNQIDAATGTLKLRAEFPNVDNALFPNQFVNVRLRVDTLKDAVVVPTAALQRSPTGTFVYIVKADGSVELRPVEVQVTDGQDTVLKQGLSGGEKVVVDGVDKLRPGLKVEVPGEGQGAPKGGR